MSIFQKIKNLFVSKEVVGDLRNVNIHSFLSEQIDLNRALAIPAVWRAVSLLSADVAKIPVDVYVKTESGREQVRDNQAAYLLRDAPNESMDGFIFRRTLTAHAILTGTGIAKIERSSRGVPRRLVILPPPPHSTVQIIENKPYWYVPGLQDDELIPEQNVLAIRGLSRDGLMGISPLEVLRDALALELSLQQHAIGFFQRGMLLAGFLRGSRPLTPEEEAAVKAAWSSMYAGVKGQHGIAVLPSDFEYKPNVVEPEKAQLSEARQFGVRQVANIFGLPPHKLGDPARTSYASLEQENADYMASSLDPWLVAWEQECNRKLLLPSEIRAGYYIEHNRNAYVRMSFGDRVEGYAKLVGIGVLSPNEVRAKENMEKIEGGDRYYVPVNWQPTQ